MDVTLDVTAKKVWRDYARREYVVGAEERHGYGGRGQSWCFLTVPGDVELDEVLEVLDVRRQPLYLVIAQTKLAKPVETEEILQKYEGLTDNEQIRKLFNNEDSFLQGIIGML